MSQILNNIKYDLEERTSMFSKNIINFSNKMPLTLTTKPLLQQLIRSATSIGANYCEANGASSRKDFKNKIHTCKKEAKETEYWLELLLKTSPTLNTVSQVLWKEAHELTLIFSKIAFNTK